jgi:hypothetical protein
MLKWVPLLKDCAFVVVVSNVPMPWLAPLGTIDHSIVVNSGDRFGCFWPLFQLLVLRKLRRTGLEARLVGVLRKHLGQFMCGANLCAR